jgi:hypothetical protein
LGVRVIGILWPHSNSIIRTNTDTRAAGAKIYFFEAGTTTPRTTYSDAALTTPRTHPVVADAYGRAPAIFLDYGDYRERVRTSGDTTLWDTDNIPNAAPATPDDEVDADSVFQTGDLIFVGKNGTRDGFVRWNGRSIGSATSGASERANPDCEDAFLYLWNNFADGQCAVSGGRGANAAADWAANKTIALPSCRGANLIGFDDMGNSAASLLGSAPVVSGSGILAGSIIGANTHTILEAHVPAHVHTVSITSGAGTAHTHGLGTLATAGNGAHTHTATTEAENSAINVGYLNPASKGATATAGGTGQIWQGGDITNTSTNSAQHTHGISTTSDPGNHTHTFTGALANESAHTHSVSGSTGSIGSGTAHNILSRSIPVTVLMKL